jgi:hypothetical protein
MMKRPELVCAINAIKLVILIQARIYFFLLMSLFMLFLIAR